MNEDYIWTVVKPRNGTSEAIDEMNAKMACYSPALRDTIKNDREFMCDAHKIVSRDFSISEMFRRALNEKD